MTDIMTDMQRTAAPPVQALLQLLNLLGKNNGGHRAITTMPTLHRLASRNRSAQEAARNTSVAHADDSAKAGTCALAVHACDHEHHQERDEQVL